MTPEFVRLRPELTVDQAIRSIRRTGLGKETINDCYITDEESRLQGTVSIRTLIVSKKDALIRDIMEENVIFVEAREDYKIFVLRTPDMSVASRNIYFAVLCLSSI